MLANITGQIVQKIKIKNQRELYRGFVMVCIACLLGIIIYAVRGYENMASDWTVSITADIFGMCLCCIIYYSCINGTDETDGNTVMFATLIIVNVIGMFLDEICWCIQGIPALALLNKIANILFYSNNFTELCMFWGYALQRLKMREKTKNIVRFLFKTLYPASILTNFLNLFVPIYFSVDAQGVYQREELFPVSQIILIIVVPPLMDGLITSEASKKEKTCHTLLCMPAYVHGNIGSIQLWNIFAAARSSTFHFPYIQRCCCRL